MKRNWVQFLSVAVAVVAGLFVHHLGWVLPAMAMGISFNSIPSNLRIPFVTVEFSNANATQGAPQLPYSVLLIGQMTSGTASANGIYPVSSPQDVLTLAGAGSMLHRMAEAYFAANTSTQTFVGVLADAGGGTAATGQLSFTGPATAAGTLDLYVGGQHVSVAVGSTDTAATIATNVTAAINANTYLAVTAAVDGTHNYQVDLTAKNKGTNGNSLDLRFNYQVGQAFPAGVACTVTAMSSGATNPSLSTLIANMGDTWYHVIGHAYTDATSLSALEAELASRAGPMRMIDGLGITSAFGSNSALATLGESRNSPHNCIVAQAGQNPLTPPEEFAAEVTGVVAFYGQIDPARPFQTLPLSWSLPILNPTDLFTNTQRNLLLFDGVATTKVGAGEQVQLERIITTYQKNAAGGADASYLDATTALNLMYLRFAFRNRFLQKYPRHKLANDGVRVGQGQPILTPKLAKAEALGWFLDMQEQGLVQNFDDFKANLVVQKSLSDPNRLDFFLPPELIDQLIVTAAQIQFSL